MDITYALFWFVMGAVLARALFTYSNQKEQRDMIVKIMASFLMISHDFQVHMKEALQISSDHLESTGMDQSEIDSHQKSNKEIIENWGIICSTIILKGAPKSYIKYFQKTDFKDFKP